MARARNIKPGIMENEEMAELDFSERLLFIYLWMLADREGRLEDRPKRIKAQAFAYDDIDIDQALCNLRSKGFILRYQALATKDPSAFDQGVISVIQITNFKKHQKPHINETESSLPSSDSAILATKAPSTCHQGSKDFDPRIQPLGSDCLIPGSGLSDSLNDDSLKKEKIIKKKIPLKNTEQASVSAEIDKYTQNPDLSKALKEWQQDRLIKKKPLTLNGIKRAFGVLNLASSDSERVKIVEQSIIAGYQGLFPLKNEKLPHGQTPDYDIDKRLQEIRAEKARKAAAGGNS